MSYISKKLLIPAVFIASLGAILSSQETYGKFFIDRTEEDEVEARRARGQMVAAHAEAGIRVAYMAERLLEIGNETDTAIKLCKQAIEHNPALQEDIASMLAFHIKARLHGNDSTQQDISAALGIYRSTLQESLDEAVIRPLRGEFNSFVTDLFNRQKAYIRAISLLRDLRTIEPANQPHKANLAVCLFAYSTMAFDGSPTNGVERNVDEATQFCQEAADLGNKNAVDTLARFSVRLFNGENVPSNRPLAISLLRKALDHDNQEGGRVLLGRMLHSYAGDFYKECAHISSSIVSLRQSTAVDEQASLSQLQKLLGAFTSKIDAAITLLTEASTLGNSHSPTALAKLRILAETTLAQ